MRRFRAYGPTPDSCLILLDFPEFGTVSQVEQKTDKWPPQSHHLPRLTLECILGNCKTAIEKLSHIPEPNQKPLTKTKGRSRKLNLKLGRGSRSQNIIKFKNC